jgi:pre-rRNA-processing protein TSR1
MPNHHHRSGPLKQANKKNKRTKSSKRSASRIAGGKVEGRRASSKHRLASHNKADRRHNQQQKKDAKHQELLRRKRGIGGSAAPPRVIGIISLGEKEETEETLRSLILQNADRVLGVNGDEKNPKTVTAKYEKHKKDGNMTILTNSTAFRSQYQSERSDDAAIFSALDLCRVCDLILFVVDVDGEKPENFVGMSIGGDDQSISTNKTSSSMQHLDHLISERGDRVLHAMKSHGLPRVATILAKTKAESGIDDDDDDDDHMTNMTSQSAKSIRRANLKRKTDVKNFVKRFATTEFGVDNEKVIEINLRDDINDNDNNQDGTIDPDAHSKRILADSLIRSLCQISAAPPNWVSKLPRSYILSDSHSYDSEIQELQITGYVRGIAPFDVNSLIHVPNLGTFSCKKLMKARIPGMRNKKSTGDMECDDDGYVVESDPMKRDDLQKFASPDALDGEQNLVGFDEADEEFHDGDTVDYNNGADKTNTEDAGATDKFARPAGWSDYQSAWLDAIDDGENGESGDNYIDLDHGELAKELNLKSAASVATNTMDIDDANEVSEEERQALLKERKDQQEGHQQFPDEVQVKDDEKARDRFARYRSLQSFKQSYWDPKENLPDSYASIYHFSSFKSTQRSVMKDMKDLVKTAESSSWNFLNNNNKTAEKMPQDAMEADNSDSDDEEDFLEGCVPAGSYVTIVLESVKPKDYNELGTNSLLCAATLLSHENKVSVVHMGLQNCMGESTEAPVKSKDVLTFRCGWRTWTGRPIFSQNNLNCDKHKFERYMPQCGSFFAASVFGPVTYTPCPMLVFRNVNGMKQLVAFGSMIGADADRTIVKRIILTGFPVRVRKRWASVKYMFNDPEDVKWFQPAGLTTKHGLNGKIEQSVGEHGTMKCLFNAPIKQHDTVCLCLYKRVYPKFVEDCNPGDEEDGTCDIRRKNALIVK